MINDTEMESKTNERCRSCFLGDSCNWSGGRLNLPQAILHRNRVATDEGIDIIAHKDELKLEPPIVKVQVKSTEGSVGGPDVRALYGNVGHGEVGLLVTLGSFSRQAEDFAKGKSNLWLIDGTELVNFVLHHYEDIDPRFKAMLPLKRVYIPSAVEVKQ